MNIVDPELRQRIKRTSAVWSVSQPVSALMDAYDYFRLCAGEDSAPAKEARQLLLSPELRPALRQWFSALAEPLNPAADAFRRQLATLAGEPLGLSPYPAA